MTTRGKENLPEPLLPAAVDKTKRRDTKQRQQLKEKRILQNNNDNIDKTRKFKNKKEKKVKTLYNDHTLKIVNTPSELSPPPTPPPPPPPPPLAGTKSIKKKVHYPLTTEYRAQFEPPNVQETQLIRPISVKRTKG